MRKFITSLRWASSRTLCSFALILLCCSTTWANDWSSFAEDETAHVRHESAFVEVGGRFYLLGGRRIQPVDIYDPGAGEWSEGQPPPIEIHHFQAVVYEGEIYVLGALTGRYPGETPTTHALIYNPQLDKWRRGFEIPPDRRRGAAGVVLHQGRFYMIAGIQDGHRSGWVPWLDCYDPGAKRWQRLPDAPRARDHFHAAVINDRIFAAGGRRSGAEQPVFAATVAEVDYFDLTTGQWSTLPASGNLPTQRAGTMAVGVGNGLIIMGGESPNQLAAHNEVEVLDTLKGNWRRLPDMKTPRHGAQAIIQAQQIIVGGGSANRGGGPEIVSLESLELDPAGARLNTRQEVIGRHIQVTSVRPTKGTIRD